MPLLIKGEVVAIDGKTSRRSGAVGKTPLHLVSAFAAGAQFVLGQQATAEKSNEKTAMPELLATLALDGCIVTIDAMGTQPNIAQAIRDRSADYILSVKDNQPTLADSMRDFFDAFQAASKKTPHQFDEAVEQNHDRLEVRRCYIFDQLDCLHAPERWPDLKSFAVIASERTVKGKTTLEHRYYITSLLPDAAQLNHAVRQHWSVETSLHWCMDVVFADDQMRARTDHASLCTLLPEPAPVSNVATLRSRILIAPNWMYHADMPSCGTTESVMQNIKMVGKSGQISLGKAMAGMGFIMQELPGGDIVLKRAVVVPMNERLLDPVVHAELEAAREWRRNNPAKATDLTTLASKLGITEE